jgi:hypothetical protein
MKFQLGHASELSRRTFKKTFQALVLTSKILNEKLRVGGVGGEMGG